MHQKGWKRPVTHPSFFLEEKLEWMDENCIDHEVILTLSQLYCNGWSQEDTREVIKFQNDYHARVQSSYKDKFTCGFVVQPLYLDDAIKEIERCVDDLDLKMLCLPTHYLDDNNQWHSTADLRLDPLYELANEKELAIEIHPYDGPKMIALQDVFWRFHLVWMCAQTADHYHLFSTLNFAKRYPKIRTCYAHGNQYGQVNIGRRKQGYEGRPDLFENGSHPNDSHQVDNVFFDTLVHDVLSFELMVKRQGVGRIVAGLDDPYPLGEMDTVAGCYPGKVIKEAVDLGIISEAESNQIWYDNVIQWLGFNPLENKS